MQEWEEKIIRRAAIEREWRRKLSKYHAVKGVSLTRLIQKNPAIALNLYNQLKSELRYKEA